jgi:hypothetical protein
VSGKGVPTDNAITVATWNETAGYAVQGFVGFSSLNDSGRLVCFGVCPIRKYHFETSLMRLEGKYDKVERYLLRNFQKYAYGRIVERDSIWHWLSVARIRFVGNDCVVCV